jgi:hypothetical protein
MVRLQTLDLRIGVRVPASQPILSIQDLPKCEVIKTAGHLTSSSSRTRAGIEYKRNPPKFRRC